RPPQQEAPAVVGAGAAVEEEPLELGQARVHDKRLLLLDREVGFGKPERVGDRQANGRKAMASPRHVVKPVQARMATAAVWPELALLVADPTDLLVGDDVRQRNSRLALEHELDPDVVAFDEI